MTVLSAMKNWRRKLLFGGALTVLLTLGWCDWRPTSTPSISEVETSFGIGSLSIGAASVALDVIEGVDRAGYPPRRPTASGQDSPLMARAVALRVQGITLCIISMDLLEVPQALAREISQQVNASSAKNVVHVVVTATHTHSSLGGYDPNLAASAAATGWFRQDQFDALARGGSLAGQQALAALKPGQLSWDERAWSGWNKNRSEKDGPVNDQLLTVALDEKASEQPVATLFSFNAHATLVPRRSDRLDADFPGRAAHAIEEKSGGVAIFVQGASGDASAVVNGADDKVGATFHRAQRMGDALSEVVVRAREDARSRDESSRTDISLAFARTDISLPRALAPATVPAFVREPASKLLGAILMDTAPVALAKIDDFWIAFIPGEPTWFAEKSLKDAIANVAGTTPRHIALVGLANGYIGYVEDEERRLLGLGESKRSLWEADLVPRMKMAFETLTRALTIDSTKQDNVSDNAPPSPGETGTTP